jgi:hypothetical protein
MVGRVSMQGRIRQKSSNGGMTYHRHILFAKICREFAETCRDHELMKAASSTRRGLCLEAELTSLTSKSSGEKHPDHQHDGQYATADNGHPKPEIIAHAMKL